MSAANPFPGRCEALYIGGQPATMHALHPLLLPYFPFCSTISLATPSLPQLTEALGSQIPKFCILDLFTGSEMELMAELLRLNPQLGIVTVVPGDNPDLILASLRQGALYFLTPPFTADQVEAAARKIVQTLPHPDVTAAPATIYSVFPAKGASGATTLACNLAYQFKRMPSARVLLADLDPYTGTLGFLLKVKSPYSFTDVLHRAADMDSDLWRAMVTIWQGIDVLLSPESPLLNPAELASAGPIVDYARLSYTHVVLDAGSAITALSLSQARLCDQVLLVVTNELAALHSAQRAVYYLESSGIHRQKIKLVLNRYRPGTGISRESVSSALGMDVFQVLPSDDAAVAKSLMEAKPVAPVSQLGKSLATFAAQLEGPVEAAQASLLRGLLSGWTRRSS